MAMYAVAISPLILRLQDENAKQVWFADDATAGGELTHLRMWWDRIVDLGLDYGYYIHLGAALGIIGYDVCQPST